MSRFNFPRRAYIGLSVVATVVSLGLSTSNAQTMVTYRLEQMDDYMEDVAGGTGVLSHAGVEYSLLGDATGFMGEFNLDLDQGFELALDEGVVPGWDDVVSANLVGQQFKVGASTYSPSAPPVDGSFENFTYAQPVAALRSFDSNALEPVSDRRGDWLFFPHVDADQLGNDFAFDGWVAELSTARSTSGYLGYYAGYYTNQYRHAILLRLDQAVDLKSAGLVLAVNTEYYDYLGAPAASTIYVGNVARPDQPSVTVVGYTNDIVSVQLTGQMSAGDHLITFEELGGPIRVAPARGLAAAITVPWVFPLNASSCTPPTPAPVTGSCTPPAAGGIGTVKTVGSVSCDPKWKWVGPAVCTPAGQTLPNSDTSCLTVSGSLKGALKKGGFSLEWTVGIGYRYCVTTTAAPGECIRRYISWTKCSQSTTKCIGIVSPGVASIDLEYCWSKTKTCLDTPVSASTGCDIIP